MNTFTHGHACMEARKHACKYHACMAGRWRQERPEFPAGIPICNFPYGNSEIATPLHMPKNTPPLFAPSGLSTICVEWTQKRFSGRFYLVSPQNGHKIGQNLTILLKICYNYKKKLIFYRYFAHFTQILPHIEPKLQ